MTTNYGAQAQALLDQRQQIWEQRKALTDSVKAGEQPTAEQRAQLDKMDKDLSRMGAEARSIVEEGERERDAAELRERATRLGTPAGVFNGGNQGRQGDGPSLSDQIRSLELGKGFVIGADQYMRPGQEARQALALAEQRVATTGAATNAGDTIPTTFVAKVLEYMLPEVGAWQAGANIITTAGGNPMDFPRLTARPSVAAVPENTAYAKSDAAFDKFTLSAHKYGVIVQISKEMVEDSGVDIAGYIARQAGVMCGRQVSHDLLIGTGSSGQPHGVLTAAVAAKTGLTTLAAGAISGDDVIALYYGIIAPYRRSANWLMNDATVGMLRGVKDSYGQYLWQPGLVSGTPDLLLGKPVQTDANMPTVAAAANCVLFGDFSTYYVRQVNGIAIERSLEYGWDSDLISYKVSWRGDGDLSDTTGSLRTLVGHA